MSLLLVTLSLPAFAAPPVAPAQEAAFQDGLTTAWMPAFAEVSVGPSFAQSDTAAASGRAGRLGFAGQARVDWREWTFRIDGGYQVPDPLRLSAGLRGGFGSMHVAVGMALANPLDGSTPALEPWLEWGNRIPVPVGGRLTDLETSFYTVFRRADSGLYTLDGGVRAEWRRLWLGFGAYIGWEYYNAAPALPDPGNQWSIGLSWGTTWDDHRASRVP